MNSCLLSRNCQSFFVRISYNSVYAFFMLDISRYRLRILWLFGMSLRYLLASYDNWLELLPFFFSAYFYRKCAILFLRGEYGVISPHTVFLIFDPAHYTPVSPKERFCLINKK